MSTSQVFLFVNIVGGVTVLTSYALGLMFYPEQRDYLWGGVTGNLSTIFIISMGLATVGYLAFFYCSLSYRSIDITDQSLLTSLHIQNILCAIFLIASTFWMPCTIAYMVTHETIWWAFTIGSLFLSAISLMTLLIIHLTTNISDAYQYKNLALIGLAAITTHCTVLDAITWVVKFPRLH